MVLHVPVPSASLKLIVRPGQTVSDTPVIATGSGLIVMIVVVMQLVGSVYVIVAVAGPAAIPVTDPVVEFTDTVISAVLHVPPPASLNMIVEPEQTAPDPKIFVGNGFTVKILVVLQPVGMEYVIFTVPEDVPVVIQPLLPIVATVALLVLHVPPGVRSVRHVDKPIQTSGVPVMATGIGLTVSVVLVVQPVGSV